MVSSLFKAHDGFLWIDQKEPSMGLVSWWDRHGVPRVIKLACGAPQIMKLRSQLVPLAKGDVFEIGCGGGINQEFYRTDAVTSYAGIDPNEKLLDYAHEAAEQMGWNADIRLGSGEDIPFDENSFDTLVCTFTLCSVQDQRQVLKEMHRILRPGGALLFLEHGRAPDADVAKWQYRIEPMWKPIAGGCHLTRAITSPIESAGFDVDGLGKGYIPKTPRFAGWAEWGRAVKSA